MTILLKTSSNSYKCWWKITNFNTAVYQQSLTLTNIILENGKSAEQGGAIYAGADVTLKIARS